MSSRPVYPTLSPCYADLCARYPNNKHHRTEAVVDSILTTQVETSINSAHFDPAAHRNTCDTAALVHDTQFESLMQNFLDAPTPALAAHTRVRSVGHGTIEISPAPAPAPAASDDAPAQSPDSSPMDITPPPSSPAATRSTSI